MVDWIPGKNQITALTKKLVMGEISRIFLPPFKSVISEPVFLVRIVDTRTGLATPGWRLLTMTW